jgi:hypothetical protein
MLFQSNLIDGYSTHAYYGHYGTFGTAPIFFGVKMSKKSKPKVKTHTLELTEYQLNLVYEALAVHEAIGMVTDDDDTMERNDSGTPLKWVATDHVKGLIMAILDPEPDE